MEQRLAVVTGAGAGIGSAIAERLSQDGHHVVLTDRDMRAAEEATAKIQALGFSAQALQMDVGQLASIDETFGAVARDHGRCDILVNNAGIAKTHSFLDFPDDEWQTTLNINLTGAFRCSQRAAQLMMLHRWGRVVNISSISGMRAGVGRTAYGTSKAGIDGLTRQIAIELASYGITANSVAPGPIETALAQKLHTEATRRELCRLVPAAHYGRPESIADTVAFLASDDAGFINGHTLPVDGGLMAAGVLNI
ncbi:MULTISPECIES: SDR family NAD(P)-dependent oxidoreductase [unclassified Rhodococcus (in: high G+C Gram-positive bacteria)]|uniref:SDR family NAD(P)-dependent oxidoreductase n=1 Tax=unclassified Rhodococcus (in: high G+C Gram-positive bacteria) TaxID=192944 RepID=UPI0016395B40|nr:MULTISPECIES: SDR family NAD(P)-dependent oxidoreductase [unclassified Rhodococcus (in: high G+C Gram-positive bacteria)]MBC2638192.1 SDR family oxidoreductase [Rhodococcus sp. 3A]MBC2897065.1 SDR family oxidoreductase [Rhodococcus sp. 4CII]